MLHENGLSLVLITVFLLSWAGQALFGWQTYNQEHSEHGEQPIGLAAYVISGHFLEATAENWESEFLQMAAFVWLTACLYQKGSPESKDPNDPDDDDQPPTPRSPWPVRRGGWVLKLYENSLALTFLLMFLVSFVLHAIGGKIEYNSEQLQHGQPAVSLGRFMTSSEFWFQSFQNWQSEFLSIGLMVVLTIFLRQKGSPESKAVSAPHSENE